MGVAGGQERRCTASERWTSYRGVMMLKMVAVQHMWGLEQQVVGTGTEDVMCLLG